jgi:hypothetical protein
MKVGETITITRESSGSTGYSDHLVALENLALAYVTADPAPVLPVFGAPSRQHYTFVAVKEGTAKVQFARFQPWKLPAALYEQVIPIDVEPKTAGADADANAEAELAAAANLKVGGWTSFAKPDDNARAVFKEAFSNLIGADYEPLLAATQVVNGLNYIFVANAKPVASGAIAHPALVRVYRSPKGPAETVKITSLGSPHRSGSYTAFVPVKQEPQDILNAALKGFAGSGFAADYVSTQLVAGMNYRFAGTQTLITKGGEKLPVLFTVYQPLSGAPVLTGVQKAYELV